MAKRQVNIRLDEDTVARLDQIATGWRQEKSDYRLGIATVIEAILNEYFQQHGVAAPATRALRESPADYEVPQKKTKRAA